MTSVLLYRFGLFWPRSLLHQYSPPKNSFHTRNISLQKAYFHQRKNASPKNICLPIFPLRFKECSLQWIKVVGVKGVVTRFLVFCPQGFSKKKGWIAGYWVARYWVSGVKGIWWERDLVFPRDQLPLPSTLVGSQRKVTQGYQYFHPKRHQSKMEYIHTNFTWMLKIWPWKRSFLLQSMFRFYLKCFWSILDVSLGLRDIQRANNHIRHTTWISADKTAVRCQLIPRATKLRRQNQIASHMPPMSDFAIFGQCWGANCFCHIGWAFQPEPDRASDATTATAEDGTGWTIIANWADWADWKVWAKEHRNSTVWRVLTIFCCCVLMVLVKVFTFDAWFR